MTPRLLRLTDVASKLGMRTTSIYRHCAEGLLTQPIKITARCSVWPEDEIDAVVASRIAGKDPGEIRALVAQLTAARATRAA